MKLAAAHTLCVFIRYNRRYEQRQELCCRLIQGMASAKHVFVFHFFLCCVIEKRYVKRYFINPWSKIIENPPNFTTAYYICMQHSFLFVTDKCSPQYSSLPKCYILRISSFCHCKGAVQVKNNEVMLSPQILQYKTREEDFCSRSCYSTHCHH